MNKSLYGTVAAEERGASGAIKLQYFLLEEELEIEACILKCYGFEIKKISLDKNTELSEVKQIHNVFFNKNEALAFLKEIADARVTPIALAGILEDYISDAIHCENRLPVLL